MDRTSRITTGTNLGTRHSALGIRHSATTSAECREPKAENYGTTTEPTIPLVKLPAVLWLVQR